MPTLTDIEAPQPTIQDPVPPSDSPILNTYDDKLSRQSPIELSKSTIERAKEDPDPRAVFKINGLQEHFEQLAKERIRKTIDVLDLQLTNMLTFSALFSAAISGLLTITWPLMNSNPSDQTDFFLQVLAHNVNSTIVAAPTPPLPFTPATDAIVINILISASLTCALLASFGAVVAKQWLLYYNQNYTRREGPFNYSHDHEYQNLLTGADRYSLRPMVEAVLPSLLQASLIMFIVGLIRFIHLSNPTVALVNSVLAIIGLVGYGISVFLAAWDPYCPYQTPISRLGVPLLIRTIVFGVHFLLGLLQLVVSVLWLPFVTTFRGARAALSQRDPKELYRRWRLGFWNLIRYLPVILVGNPHDVSKSLLKLVGPHYRRDPPSADASYGESAAWLLKTTADSELLYSVVRSVLTINDLSFLRAFSNEKGWEEIAWASEESGAQLRDLKRRPGAHPSAVLLDLEREQILFQDTLLHMYVGLEQVDGIILYQAKEALCAFVKTPRKYNITSKKVDYNVPIGSHASVVAASIKMLLAARSYRWEPNSHLYVQMMDEQILEELETQCLFPVSNSIESPTPTRIASLVALAVGLVPLRPKEPHKFNIDIDLPNQQEMDHRMIRKSYVSTTKFLSNVTLAIQTYWLKVWDPKSSELPIPSDAIYASLLQKAILYVEGNECESSYLSTKALPLISVIGPFLRLEHAGETYNSANVTTVAEQLASRRDRKQPDQRSIVQALAIELVAALLVRLQTDNGGPFVDQTLVKDWFGQRQLETFAISARFLSRRPSVPIAFAIAFRCLAGLAKSIMRNDIEEGDQVALDAATTELHLSVNLFYSVTQTSTYLDIEQPEARDASIAGSLTDVDDGLNDPSEHQTSNLQTTLVTNLTT